ncbi:MAG TPA: DUF6072 family protein [Pyrinomonadaceae bacterium]
MPNEPANVNNVVVTGLHVAGEYVFPGGSNLVKGDFQQAALHAGAGILAAALFGPIGLLLVRANSLSVALTDRSLSENLSSAATPSSSSRTAK